MTRPQARPRGPRPAPDEGIDPVDTQSRAVAPPPEAVSSPETAQPSVAAPPAAHADVPSRQREGQIPLNVALPTSVFAKLDELVTRTGKTKKTLIADLITAAYHGS